MKYSTSSITLTAYLLLEGFTLDQITGDERRVFIFEQDEEEVFEAEKRFFNRKALVEPQSYSDEIRILKARIRK